MRKFKFRIWCPIDSKFLLSENNEGLNFTYDKNPESMESFNLDLGALMKGNGGVVVQQFTGLKDKNGREIYEGDLIKNSDGLVMSVKWNENRCCFAGAVGNVDGWMTFMKILLTDFEVVGNIFENSNLLENI